MWSASLLQLSRQLAEGWAAALIGTNDAMKQQSVMNQANKTRELHRAEGVFIKIKNTHQKCGKKQIAHHQFCRKKIGFNKTFVGNFCVVCYGLCFGLKEKSFEVAAGDSQ